MTPSSTPASAMRLGPCRAARRRCRPFLRASGSGQRTTVTHASFPAFTVVTAQNAEQEFLSTRQEPIGANRDAHGAATTKQAALDSASQNGTALPDSGEDSDPPESDEESDSDADAHKDVAVCGQCHVYNERNEFLFYLCVRHGEAHAHRAFVHFAIKQ